MAYTYYLNPETGQTYVPGKSFSYDGVNYTKRGATPETFRALGFEEKVAPPYVEPPDVRFYLYGPPNLRTGQYTVTPRPLDQVQEHFIWDQKRWALTLLAPTDPLVMAAFEAGQPASSLPEEIKNYRNKVRQVESERIVAIGSAATVEALELAINLDEQQKPGELTPWPEM